MRRRRLAANKVLFSVAAILCAFHAFGFSQSEEPSDEEYRVYDAVIADKERDGTDFGSLLDGRLLVIQEQTDGSSGRSNQWDYVKERIKPSEEALVDYKANREKPAKLTHRFSTKSQYVLLSKKAWEGIFKVGGSYDYESGWKKYYEKYPKSRGYISFSRAGFNKSKSEAFLYFEHWCGSLCASGYFISLRKRAEKWSVNDIVMIWIS